LDFTLIRPVAHILLHFVLPGLVGRWAFPGQWKRAWLLMTLTMLVDLDHLLAHPIYDPNRCGIGFHPLHSYLAMAIYAALTIMPRTRIIGVGLLIHMALDSLDCILILSG
jgi:hypothetical protein